MHEKAISQSIRIGANEKSYLFLSILNHLEFIRKLQASDSKDD